MAMAGCLCFSWRWSLPEARERVRERGRAKNSMSMTFGTVSTRFGAAFVPWRHTEKSYTGDFVSNSYNTNGVWHSLWCLSSHVPSFTPVLAFQRPIAQFTSGAGDQHHRRRHPYPHRHSRKHAYSTLNTATLSPKVLRVARAAGRSLLLLWLGVNCSSHWGKAKVWTAL